MKTMRTILSISITIIFLTSCAHTANAPQIQPVGCQANPKRQADSTVELINIAKVDQADRSGPYDSIDWNKVNPRDSSRRIRVATLFAAALDRYLVQTGHKQLFGTQMSRNASQDWCIQPVELTFPESLRIKYVKFSVRDQIAHTLKGIGATISSSDVKECTPNLKSTPKGSVPGFW